MQKETKTPVLKRLGRIEGQVRGIVRMVEEDRYCIDVVTQISAVRAALRRVEEEILRDHVAHCVEHAIAAGNKGEQRKKIAELMEVVGRSVRLPSGTMKYPSHDWGALAKNPSLKIGATGEAWISAVRSAWLDSGGTEESFERTFPAYAVLKLEPAGQR